MRLFYPLLFSMVFFLCICNQVQGQDGKPCEVGARVDVETVSTLGKATVTVFDGVAPYRYIFHESTTGKQLQKDFSKPTIENLKAGSYFCIVADNRGCIKRIQFQIQ